MSSCFGNDVKSGEYSDIVLKIVHFTYLYFIHVSWQENFLKYSILEKELFKF